MSQSKIESLVEAIVNTSLGIFVSFVVWPIAAWINGIEYTFNQQIGMVVMFTIASIVRGYVVRRYFDKHLNRFSKSIVKYYGKINLRAFKRNK